MLKSTYVSLVLPCKNEAMALRTVLENLPKGIDEVIVVDNNSNDQTARVAKDYGAKLLFEARSNKSGVGYGFALQKGISKARGNIIVCMDGDGSYPVKEIPTLIKNMVEKNLDFISCNRLPFKDPKKMSFVREMGVKILNLISWVLFGHKIKDSLSGMWVFKKSVYDELNPTQGGWNFSLEIKLRAIVHPRFKFKEVQIPYQDRVLDLSKQNLILTGLEHVTYLLTFKLGLVRLALLNFEPNFSLRK